MTSRVDHNGISTTVANIMLVSTHVVYTSIRTRALYIRPRNTRHATTRYFCCSTTPKERNSGNIVALMDKYHPSYGGTRFPFCCVD